MEINMVRNCQILTNMTGKAQFTLLRISSSSSLQNNLGFLAPVGFKSFENELYKWHFHQQKWKVLNVNIVCISCLALDWTKNDWYSIMEYIYMFEKHAHFSRFLIYSGIPPITHWTILSLLYDRLNALGYAAILIEWPKTIALMKARISGQGSIPWLRKNAEFGTAVFL